MKSTQNYKTERIYINRIEFNVIELGDKKYLIRVADKEDPLLFDNPSRIHHHIQAYELSFIEVKDDKTLGQLEKMAVDR